MSDIFYVEGDATNPPVGGNKIIVHCCNDIGGWGSGFVVPLAKRWPASEWAYRSAFDNPGQPRPALGDVIWVNVHGGLPGDRTDLFVANLIGQHGVKGNTEDGEVPIRYDAINVGFRTIARAVLDRYPATIHMPRMGCGLAGGDWRVIEALIKANFTDIAAVYVYDLPGQPFGGAQ